MERERERSSIHVREKPWPVASSKHPDWGPTHNLGVCPDWGGNLHPFGLQETATLPGPPVTVFTTSFGVVRSSGSASGRQTL